MPPSKKTSNGSAKRTRVEGGNLNRTTIFLPDVMDENLACLALQTGESRATLVRQALAKFMKEQYGYEPYKKPRVNVSHR